MAHTNGSVAKPEWWWGYRHGTPQTKSKKTVVYYKCTRVQISPPTDYCVPMPTERAIAGE